MNTSKRVGIQLLLSVVVAYGCGGSVVLAQSGSLEPPSTAVNGRGDPTPTTQTQPSWDQLLPANERFQVLTRIIGGDGGPVAIEDWGVLDKNTGLVWELSPGETDGVLGITLADRLNWTFARLECANHRTGGGQKGWRLPSMQELASLVDADQLNPALPVNHPFNNIQFTSLYWSATTNAALPSDAWVVGFGNGNVGTFTKTNLSFVWCVRGGGPLSEY